MFWWGTTVRETKPTQCCLCFVFRRKTILEFEWEWKTPEYPRQCYIRTCTLLPFSFIQQSSFDIWNQNLVWVPNWNDRKYICILILNLNCVLSFTKHVKNGFCLVFEILNSSIVERCVGYILIRMKLLKAYL